MLNMTTRGYLGNHTPVGLVTFYLAENCIGEDVLSITHHSGCGFITRGFYTKYKHNAKGGVFAVISFEPGDYRWLGP